MDLLLPDSNLQPAINFQFNVQYSIRTELLVLCIWVTLGLKKQNEFIGFSQPCVQLPGCPIWPGCPEASAVLTKRATQAWQRLYNEVSEKNIS